MQYLADWNGVSYNCHTGSAVIIPICYSRYIYLFSSIFRIRLSFIPKLLIPVIMNVHLNLCMIYPKHSIFYHIN